MEDIYQEIYELHSRQLRFKDVRLRPVLVVFSAVPGSGKTELTKRLVKDYGFLRIANKDIRNALERTGHAKDVVIGEYTLWLLDKLIAEKRYSIVFDRNIDQWYEPSKEWAAKNDYQYILVRIDVPRQLLEARLYKREGTHNAKVFEVLGFYEDQHRTIARAIKPSLFLEGDYDLDVATRRIMHI